MSYFVWNEIDHAVVRGNDKKDENNEGEKRPRSGTIDDRTLSSRLIER